MSCAWNALEELESLIDYKSDGVHYIQKVADRIAKRHKVVAFWNEFDEINFRAMEENETAGFIQ